MRELLEDEASFDNFFCSYCLMLLTQVTHWQQKYHEVATVLQHTQMAMGTEVTDSIDPYNPMLLR